MHCFSPSVTVRACYKPSGVIRSSDIGLRAQGCMTPFAIATSALQRTTHSVNGFINLKIILLGGVLRYCHAEQAVDTPKQQHLLAACILLFSQR